MGQTEIIWQFVPGHGGHEGNILMWRLSPWVLSASDRPGTALCLRLISPASSACPGQCPWTASPGNCGQGTRGSRHSSGTADHFIISIQKWTGTYKSRKRSSEISAVKTSRSPITCSGETQKWDHHQENSKKFHFSEEQQAEDELCGLKIPLFSSLHFHASCVWGVAALCKPFWRKVWTGRADEVSWWPPVSPSVDPTRNWKSHIHTECYGNITRSSTIQNWKCSLRSNALITITVFSTITPGTSKWNGA